MQKAVVTSKAVTTMATMAPVPSRDTQALVPTVSLCVYVYAPPQHSSTESWMASCKLASQSLAAPHMQRVEPAYLSSGPMV